MAWSFIYLVVAHNRQQRIQRFGSLLIPQLLLISSGELFGYCWKFLCSRWSHSCTAQVYLIYIIHQLLTSVFQNHQVYSTAEMIYYFCWHQFRTCNIAWQYGSEVILKVICIIRLGVSALALTTRLALNNGTDIRIFDNTTHETKNHSGLSCILLFPVYYKPTDTQGCLLYSTSHPNTA